MTRPNTKCRRKSCRLPFHAHPDGMCPNGSGAFRVCQVYRDRNRASTSFSTREIEALDETLRMLRRGGDLRLLARQLSGPLGTIASKVDSARQRIAAQNSAPERGRALHGGERCDSSGYADVRGDSSPAPIPGTSDHALSPQSAADGGIGAGAAARGVDR